jgi:threonine synthase
VVSEDQLGAAYRLGVQAGYPADATGTAGLAGLPELLESGAIAPEHTVAVLFTGIQRSGT